MTAAEMFSDALKKSVGKDLEQRGRKPVEVDVALLVPGESVGAEVAITIYAITIVPGESVGAEVAITMYGCESVGLGGSHNYICHNYICHNYICLSRGRPQCLQLIRGHNYIAITI